AEPISAAGTIGSASLSPSKPDRPPPLGRPELIGKPCFPTEVRPSPPDFPARISPSFLHQIDRALGVRSTRSRDLRRVKLARTICRRSARDPPPGYSKFPRHHVRWKNFGIGQNTGETLPKFRQKPKENLKRI
ncbi:hypothetical protein Prudu_591S000100, partial [Prunus dulcis]